MKRIIAVLLMLVVLGGTGSQIKVYNYEYSGSHVAIKYVDYKDGLRTSAYRLFSGSYACLTGTTMYYCAYSVRGETADMRIYMSSNPTHRHSEGSR